MRKRRGQFYADFWPFGFMITIIEVWLHRSTLMSCRDLPFLAKVEQNIYEKDMVNFTRIFGRYESSHFSGIPVNI